MRAAKKLARPRRALAGVAVTALALALAAGGCAATDKGDPPVRTFEPLLSRTDLNKYRRGTPEAAVMRLWYFAQLGSAPNVAAFYHPRVLRSLSVSRVVGAYDLQRETFLASRPKPVIRESTPAGMMIRLEVTSTLRDGRPIPATQRLAKTVETYILRRRGDDWVIIYDTVLRRALPTYVQSITGPFTKNDRTGEREGIKQGRQAAQQYRGLFAQDFAGDDGSERPRRTRDRDERDRSTARGAGTEGDADEAAEEAPTAPQGEEAPASP